MRGSLHPAPPVRANPSWSSVCSGLRREEPAQLAGVSATYYTRLEQWQSINASVSVIDSIGRALNLNPDERAHLHDLARPTRAKHRTPIRPDHARAGTVRLLEAMIDIPAVVMGRRNEILAWNRLGHLLLGGHLDFDSPARSADRPNLTRMLFLHLPDGDGQRMLTHTAQPGSTAEAALTLLGAVDLPTKARRSLRSSAG